MTSLYRVGLRKTDGQYKGTQRLRHVIAGNVVEAASTAAELEEGYEPISVGHCGFVDAVSRQSFAPLAKMALGNKL